MLRFIRRTRAFALFALLVMAGSVPVAISATLHDDDDDTSRQPSLVLHDESAHRIGAARAVVPDSQHCVVCHWLQSLHRTTVAHRGPIPPSTHSQQFVVAATALAASAAFAARAARAPPSSL